MCGLAGILRVHPPDSNPPPHRDVIPEHWLDALDAAIRHRGPDGAGRFRDRAVRPDGSIVDIALVHRRLSIIDHEGGHQPMVHVRHDAPPGSAAVVADGSSAARPPAGILRPTDPDGLTIDATGHPPAIDLVAVVFNGCLYNHREIRAELERKGHRFETDHSDTEALVHGWREWNRGLFDRLVSMHAAAIWDRRLASLTLARDLFGEKPLYLVDLGHEAESLRHVAFASTAAALVALHAESGQAEPAALDRAGVQGWVRFGFEPSRTPFPACAQLSQSDVVTPLERREHDVPAKPPARIRRGGLAWSRESIGRRDIERLDHAIGAAVRTRLDADVPVAALLSGGVDSSLVCARATRELDTLTTVCVRMPVDAYDESSHAAAVAAHLGTRHITVDADPRPAEDLIDLIETLGLPFGDSSLLPTYWACRAAAEVAGVVLTGDGGDELFVGYDRHMAMRCAGFAGFLPPGFGAAWLPARDPRTNAARARRLLLAWDARDYRELLSLFEPGDRRRLALDRPASSIGRDKVWDIEQHGAANFDLHHTLPGDYLRKVDTASMAVPIEVRAPLLDRGVFAVRNELARWKALAPRQRKWLLRELARRYLPGEIVDRPKQGFAIPVGAWFRSDFGGMRQLLYDHLTATEPFPGLEQSGLSLGRRFIERMLREHDAAGDPSPNPWHGRDHSQRLYALLVLSIWCRWLARLPRPVPSFEPDHAPSA